MCGVQLRYCFGHNYSLVLRHPEPHPLARLTKDPAARRIFATFMLRIAALACIYAAKKYYSFAKSNYELSLKVCFFKSAPIGQLSHV